MSPAVDRELDYHCGVNVPTSPCVSLFGPDEKNSVVAPLGAKSNCPEARDRDLRAAGAAQQVDERARVRIVGAKETVAEVADQDVAGEASRSRPGASAMPHGELSEPWVRNDE